MLIPVLLAVSLATGLAPSLTQETPQHGACDATGKLVCGGADVGATVTCNTDNTPHAACAWTFGWLTEGFSPAQLPGNETHVLDASVRICSSVSGCEAPILFHLETACAWGPALDCLDSRQGPAGSATRPLALGECVRIDVDVQATIDAAVVDGVAQLARAHFHNAGTAAGAACYVDNGRD